MVDVVGKQSLKSGHICKGQPLQSGEVRQVESSNEPFKVAGFDDLERVLDGVFRPGAH